MASCEAACPGYPFKLRLTKGARQLAERLADRDGWEDAGQGWWGIEAGLRPPGWSRTRRVVVLRRLLPGTVALTRSEDGEGDLFRADAGLDGRTPLRPVRESIRFTCRLQEQTP